MLELSWPTAIHLLHVIQPYKDMVLFLLKHFDHLITQNAHLEKLGIHGDVASRHFPVLVQLTRGMTAHHFRSLNLYRIIHLHESTLLL